MKGIISVCLGSLAGVLIGLCFLNISNSYGDISSSSNNVYAIQIGVYDDFNNARNYALKNDAYVFYKDNHYLVYYAILSNFSYIESFTKYLTDNNIEYYLKSISVSNSFYKYIIEQEETVINDNNKLNSVRKSILERYDINEF